MQFQPVNKTQYRQRYKMVSICLVVALIVMTLSLSTLLIALWGEPEAGSNFWLNVTSVGVSALLLAGLLLRYKNHPYMSELCYVWDLKQELNQIIRKLRKIRQAAEHGDVTALLILGYYYEASEQLWNLDDNTLVMPELNEWKLELKKWLNDNHADINVADYHRELLQSYK